MATAIMGLLAALFAAIPAILNVLEGRKAKANALRKRNVDELSAGAERVRSDPTVQP